MKKEKKVTPYIAPNEASFRRWIAVLVVGFLLGSVLGIPFGVLRALSTGDTFLGTDYRQIWEMMASVLLFVGQVIAIRRVGKTSVKDFVLGVGGKVNKKECLTILGLYALGMVISYLPVLGNIRLRGVSGGGFAFLVVFMLLTAWTQTTWEELIFRGLVIRWTCKNDVRFTKKALIGAIVTSVLFALAHAPNPEVTTQSGIRVLIQLVCYAIPGLVLFLADLYFGSLLPGILIHWLNNFTLFTLIASEVTALPVPTLLVDTTPHKAEWSLVSTVIVYVPVLVYMILDARMKKRAAAREEMK